MVTPAVRRRLAAALALSGLAACSTDPPAPVAPVARLARGAAPPAAAGAVYTMTNAAGGNAILAFRRAPDGSLTPLGAVPTGGRGTGTDVVDPLGSQHSVRLSDDRRFLFAVNAGSDDVSSLAVGADGSLRLLDRRPSGGDMPVSVAAHGRLLYVLNAGDGTLRGLRVGGSGELRPVPRSTRDLGIAAGQGADVVFTPNGRQLVVVLKDVPVRAAPSRILVFPVRLDGRLGAPTRTTPDHPPAVAVDVTRDLVVVAQKSGFVTSYRVSGPNLAAPALDPVASDSTGGGFSCWIEIAGGGRYVYTPNTVAATIAGRALGARGELAPLTSTGVVGALPAGSAPLDLAASDDDRFLHVLEGATGAVATFAVNDDGTLSGPTRTPAGGRRGRQGLAAF